MAAVIFTFGTPFPAGMSHLSLEYYQVPVSATAEGVPYNPVSDALAFAFMPTSTQVPSSGDWVTGSWGTDSSSILYPYSALCLVGPSGVITLGIGTYVAYIKITDSPEIPVEIAGQLQIS
jgi:hypothetical protein